MKFGLMAGTGTPTSGDTWRERFERSLAWSREVAGLGYEYLWSGGGDRGADPQAVMTRLAAVDAGMGLGILYLLPLYHPVRLATEIATWDQATRGRTVVAVAQGWRDRQFRAYGVPREQRLSRFVEVLDAMKQLWRQDAVSFRGNHFEFETYAAGGRADAAAIVPRPVQQPHPTVLVAANSDIAVRRTATIADGWLISTRSTYPVIQRQAEVLREAGRAAGRRPVIWAWRDAYCAPDRRTAFETVRPALESFYADRAQLGHDRDLPAGDRLSGAFEDVVRDRLILGSPEDCIREIERYRDLGVEAISMRMRWEGMTDQQAMQSVRLMAEKVLPRFR